MEAYIQKPSGNQLYRSCKNDSKQKDHSLTHLMSAALKRIKQCKHGKYTKSVHRAYRTVEKSPVYTFPKVTAWKITSTTHPPKE